MRVSSDVTTHHFIIISLEFISPGSRGSFTRFCFSPPPPAASQMVITDLSQPERRADGLSKLGLSFGIGMIAGSTLGGHLNTRYG